MEGIFHPELPRCCPLPTKSKYEAQLAFGEVTAVILKAVSTTKQSKWLYIRMKRNVQKH